MAENKWVTGVIFLVIGIITAFIALRGPTLRGICSCFHLRGGRLWWLWDAVGGILGSMICNPQCTYLRGGFNNFLFSPLFRENFQFD